METGEALEVTPPPQIPVSYLRQSSTFLLLETVLHSSWLRTLLLQLP